MSSAVMTDVDAPTMPANCRFVVTLPVCELLVEGLLGGAPPGLPVCETLGATRRAPAPSSLIGLARVRFASEGGLTSIGGSCSGSGLLRPGGGHSERENGRKKS